MLPSLAEEAASSAVVAASSRGSDDSADGTRWYDDEDMAGGHWDRA